MALAVYQQTKRFRAVRSGPQSAAGPAGMRDIQYNSGKSLAIGRASRVTKRVQKLQKIEKS